MRKHLNMLVTGGVIGLIAVLLVASGNPVNMGFCIACFLRDIAGSLGLHGAEIVQNMRPEIIGLVLGSAVMAMVGKEFKPKGGSSPVTRFTLGFFVMIGALVFLGCPLRMLLRIAGGDLNAIIGLVGFTVGIGMGVLVLKQGFSLKRAYPQSYVEGAILPTVALMLLGMLLVIPTVFIWSQSGPGAAAAPILVALGAGLVVGALAQKTRFCMVGGIRDAFMFKDFHLLIGAVALVVVALVGNILTDSFNVGFAEQAVAHTDALWNFMGMVLVGWGCVLLGGCPMRQLILAGEGNADSVVTVIGFIVGAAFAHNYGFASSPAGPTGNGKVAVMVGLVVLFVISAANMRRIKK